MALWSSKWRRNYFLVMNGFFDETGQCDQPVNGIGGYLISCDRMFELEGLWQEVFQRDFHDKNIRTLKRKEKNRKKGLDILEKVPLLPLGYLVSMDLINGLNTQERSNYDEPYFRAYGHCLNMSIHVNTNRADMEKRTATEQVVAVFEEKMEFADHAMSYHKRWRELYPQPTGRMALPPSFRGKEGFPLLHIADMVAGILRSELIRRIDEPKSDPLESFVRLQGVAANALGVNNNRLVQGIPFALITDRADIEMLI